MSMIENPVTATVDVAKSAKGKWALVAVAVVAVILEVRGQHISRLILSVTQPIPVVGDFVAKLLTPQPRKV